MRLHLFGVADFALYYLDNEYIEVPRPMKIGKIKQTQGNNQMMIDLESSISYAKFDDAKNCTTANKMWDMLAQIHEGDINVLTAKAKSLKGKFDDMRME